MLSLKYSLIFTEDTLYRVKQPGSGIVIYVDPLNSDIGPFKAIPVDIYIFADTWGIYVDELEINITGLPQYTIGICAQVVGSPISLSISDRNEFNVPVIRYIQNVFCFKKFKFSRFSYKIVFLGMEWYP